MPLVPLLVFVVRWGGIAYLTSELLKRTYEYKILNLLREKKGNKWPQNYGLSDKMTHAIIARYRWYIVNGIYKYPSSTDSPAVATAKYREITNKIASEMKIPLSGKMYNGVYAVIYAIMHDIPPKEDAFYNYVRGGVTTEDKIINLPADAIKKTDEFIEKVLPWYLKPATLISVGAVVVAVYLFGPAIRLGATKYAESKR